jgi:hypothetical protein
MYLTASSNSDLFSGCFRFTVNISSNMDLYFSLTILFQLILFEFTVDGVCCLFTYHVKAQITTLVSYVNVLTYYMKS